MNSGQASPAAPAPSVQRLGNAVLLQGVAIHDAAYLIKLGLRVSSGRDGVHPSDRWLRLYRELQSATSDTRNGAASSMPSAPDFPVEDLDLITTREAAMLLRLSLRQVQNLAPSLGARRVGRQLLLDRDLVTTEASRRNRTRQ